MGRVRALVAVAVLAALPAAPGRASAPCEPSDPVPVALNALADRFTEEPSGGRWRPWLVAPEDVEVPGPPATASPATAIESAEVRTATATRDAADIAAIHRWDDGPAAAPWTEIYLGLVRTYSPTPGYSPPRISRQIAILETTMSDALVATWAAKYCYLRPAPWMTDPTIDLEGEAVAAPSYPSEHATVAGVASVLLPTFFPAADPTQFEAMAIEALDSRVAAGAAYRSDVMKGYLLGRDVARLALERRAADGSSATWDGSGRITGKCNWDPTPPAFTYPPAEPVWGGVTPWVLSSGSQLRPAAPPACDSDEYDAAARDLYETSLTLTDRQRSIALYWAGGPGTDTPPGMNLRTAMGAVVEGDLNALRASRVLAHVSAAMADAAIAAWDAKFTYWWDRPVQTIRRLWDKNWVSFITTPPFPGYVSGHSTFSGAAMDTLGWFFPEDAVAYRSMATEAAMSRFYGGIHARYDNEVGLTLGERIAALTVARAQSDRAG